MTINTVEVTPNNLKECLKTVVVNPILRNRAQYLWGPPGCGKSQIIKQIADELNYKLYDVRLTTKDSTDLTGLPYLHEESKRTIYYIPEFFPTAKDIEDAGYNGGIIFLDELSAASLQLQAASYELCLDRRIGRYELPDNVVVIAAGNKVDDGAIAYELTSALSDRFVHYSVVPNPKSFLDYGEMMGFHSSVLTMIKTHPEFLTGSFESMASDSDDKIVPSPRSWEVVSNIMKEIENETVRKVLVSGTIGNAAAEQFFFVIQELDSLLPMSEYIRVASTENEKAVKEIMPTQLPGLYGLGYSLPAFCDTEEDYIAACFVFNVMATLDNLPGTEIMCNAVNSLFERAQKSGGIAKARAVRRSNAYKLVREQMSEFIDNERYKGRK
jgi:hypothetical protein